MGGERGGGGTSEGDVEEDTGVVVSFFVGVDVERTELTGDCPRRGGRWVPFLLMDSSNEIFRVIFLDSGSEIFLVVWPQFHEPALLVTRVCL